MVSGVSDEVNAFRLVTELGDHRARRELALLEPAREHGDASLRHGQYRLDHVAVV